VKCPHQGGQSKKALPGKNFETLMGACMPDRIIRRVGQILAPLDNEARRESMHESRSDARPMISDGMQARKAVRASAERSAKGNEKAVTGSANAGQAVDDGPA
jgi:hypothetical protein